MSTIKQAIEALENVRHHISSASIYFANGEAEQGQKILGDAIRMVMETEAALAALRSMPAEPVAWYDVENGQIISAPRWYSDGGRTEAPLYATPPTAPVLSEAWQPIETAPRDGSVFVAAKFVEGETPDPDFDYELGHYKPLVFDRYEEAGDNLFRKVPEQVYDWHGFNNFGRMTHWMPLPSAAVIGRAGGGA